MVLLVAKISKIYSKLESNIHHHNSQSSNEIGLSQSLEGFYSQVFSAFNVKSSPKSATTTVTSTFSSIQSLFEMIPITSKAFANLVMAIDYPISKWESDSVEQYLNYALTLLDIFNSITSSLSHLGLAKLSISYGLCVKEEKSLSLALKHLKPIESFSLEHEKKNNKAGFGFKFKEKEEWSKGSHCSTKEETIHRALLVMERMGNWVCLFALSSLTGEDYLKDFGDGFGSDLRKVEMVKEVKDLNESMARFVALNREENFISDEAEEKDLKECLEAFDKGLKGFESEIDCLFNELLGKRNQLLNGFRVQNRKE